VLAELEGRIDFPDDDLDVADDAWLDAELAQLHAGCFELVDGFKRGRAMSHGISVALVGAVNVGKSSLLNALVGRERVLVAEDPGTTRDFVEIDDVWNGVRVTIVDTAGTRETTDHIEQQGIAFGEKRAALADVVVVINDGKSLWNDGATFGDRALVIRSKIDLGGEVRDEVVRTSARTGAGIDQLKRLVLEKLDVVDREGSEDAVITTERQREAVIEARSGIGASRQALQAKQPLELIALELRTVTRALARLRGVEVGERVLDELFARFCIGK
jgi:tRNA modification GTPase